MCLAIPGKVIEIFHENGLKMGKIEYNGSVNTACLAYVPEVDLNQYVIVHAGFAISVLNEEEARDVFEAWDDVLEAVKKDGYTVDGQPSDPENIQ